MSSGFPARSATPFSGWPCCAAVMSSWARRRAPIWRIATACRSRALRWGRASSASHTRCSTCPTAFSAISAISAPRPEWLRGSRLRRCRCRRRPWRRGRRRRVSPQAATTTNCCSAPRAALPKALTSFPVVSGCRSPLSAQSRKARGFGWSMTAGATSRSGRPATATSKAVLVRRESLFAQIVMAGLLAAAFFAAALAGTGPALAAKAEHKEGGAKEGAARDATDSIKLPPITVPLISAGNVVGQAGVLVQLQLANPGDFGLVDRERGHLVDAFFRELYVLFDQLQGVSSEVSAPIIKEHLTHAADRILGPGKIRDILILGSYERRRPS